MTSPRSVPPQLPNQQPESKAAQTSAVVAIKQDPAWETATAEQREILLRIAAQRDRLSALHLAHLQTQALRTQQTSVPADAPLIERVTTFARLHPVATISFALLAVTLGPRKLLRTGLTVLPWVSKILR